MQKREEGRSAYKVGGLTIAVVSPLTGHLLGNVHGDPVGAGAGGVNHAHVGAGAVAIDLVEGHGQLASLADPREAAVGHGHDPGNARLDLVDVVIVGRLCPCQPGDASAEKGTARWSARTWSVSPQENSASPSKTVVSCWKGVLRVPSRGVEGSTAGCQSAIAALPK